MYIANARPAVALAALTAMLWPSTAVAQGVPRPENNASCAMGDTGQFVPGPGGSQLGINYPESINCGGTSLAGAPGATAIGDGARATGSNSIALGHDAMAAQSGSAAIGAGAVSTAANQVTLGGSGTSVRIGDIAASTAAQAGSVGLMTVDSSGTLGIDRELVPGMRRDAREGVAAAVAIGYAPMPSAAGRTSYVFNLATFRGEHAIGASIMHRLPTAAPFALTVGFSYAGHKNNAARVGVAGEF